MKKKSKETVQAIVRAIDVLESFTLQRPELTLSEISEKTRLNKTTVYRILQTLRYRGYIEQDRDSQRYSLGFNCFNLGSIVINHMDLRKAALEPMKELSRECGETIVLFVPDENSRVCLERIDSNYVIRNFMQIGGRYPLHRGAPGKVFFLNKDENAIRKFLEREGCKEEEIASFLQVVAQGRREGYLLSIEENFEGAFAVAAPVYNNAWEICASVSICGPIIRLTEEKREVLGRMVVSAAKEISKKLGYGG